MARIRTIKPSFWGDEEVSELTRDARLLLVGLISSADDQGRFMASHAVISGYVFPYDGITAAKLGQWLEEIAATGIVELYKAGRRETPDGKTPSISKSRRLPATTTTLVPEPGGRVMFRTQPWSDSAPNRGAIRKGKEGKGLEWKRERNCGSSIPNWRRTDRPPMDEKRVL